MALENVFENDIFSQIELTASINKMPFKPSMLGAMGLFAQKPIRTTTAMVEEQNGKLVLIQSMARGDMSNVTMKERRKARAFVVPHLPLNSAVLADDVQGIREFGEEEQVKQFSTEVNDKLEIMRQSHEFTHEFHRMGAISGQVLDADLSVMYDWFDEFGIAEQSYDFDFSAAATGSPIKGICRTIRFQIEDALGAAPYTSIMALCERSFFTDLISAPEIKEAYERYENGSHFREDQREFSYGDITWKEYRGKIGGGTSFIEEGKCRFFPVGAPDIFQVAIAPANFIETVNTRGQLIYTKQERMKYDMGMELHSQSNPLHICTRPATLAEGVSAGGSGS